jgi:hypothetical protein
MRRHELDRAVLSTVILGATQSFSASLCVAQNGSIVWDVNGVVGGNSIVGTIVAVGSSEATFTAPAKMPSPQREARRRA